ncbi:MAG: cell wall-binding repeat-containing protein [Lachnospiraceae bacterium]|nr:cell wall-binding repeat-containing protein [Candidatus Equihabitans merdae]
MIQKVEIVRADEMSLSVGGFTLTYTGDEEGTIDEVGTNSWSSADGGPVYVVSLPYGTEIRSFDRDTDILSLVNVHMSSFSEGQVTAINRYVQEPSRYMSNAGFKGRNNNSYKPIYDSITWNEGYSLPLQDVTGFVLSGLRRSDWKYNLVFVQIEAGENLNYHYSVSSNIDWADRADSLLAPYLKVTGRSDNRITYTDSQTYEISNYKDQPIRLKEVVIDGKTVALSDEASQKVDTSECPNLKGRAVTISQSGKVFRVTVEAMTGYARGDVAIRFVFDETTPLYTPSVSVNNKRFGSYGLPAFENTANSTLWTIDLKPDRLYECLAVKDGEGHVYVPEDNSVTIEVTKPDTALTIEFSKIVAVCDIHDQAELTAFMLRAQDTESVGTLACDIALDGFERVQTFYGILDGNGHTLTVSDGFWGLINENEGIIRNLTIDSEDKLVNPSSLFCYSNRGSINNCRNKASVVFRGEHAVGGYGGICNTNTGSISKCINTGSISNEGDGQCCFNNVGGICVQNEGTIEDCYNSGNIYVHEGSGMMSRRIGGIAAVNQGKGIIRYCYNLGLLRKMNPWVEPTGWDYMVYTWISEGSNMAPIVGKNTAGETAVSESYYIDSLVTLAEDGLVTVPLSDDYLTSAGTFGRNVKEAAGMGSIKTYPFIERFVLEEGNQTFAEGSYYLYYDAEHDHFIAVKHSEDVVVSGDIIINAEHPSDLVAKGRSYRGLMPGNGMGEGMVDDPTYGNGYLEKDIYLVEVPADAKTVAFSRTGEILDSTCGMNNLYGFFYDTSSAVLRGTKYIDSTTQDVVLDQVSERWPEAYDAINAVFGRPLGSMYGGEAPSQNDDITVTFRLIGSTLSESGDYDVGEGRLDAKYINWLETRSVEMRKGDTVGDLLAKVLEEEGMKQTGLSSNYIASMTAPAVLGGYDLGEFDNGKYAGWMYLVNGSHPGVALNNYYLKDGDAVIWHFINDYRYESSDWFADEDYPNLGDETTWDPWEKVPDLPAEYFAGNKIIKVAGQDRFATAAAIAKEAFPEAPDEIIVVTGENFPDALAANAYAGAKNGAVILTMNAKLPSDIKALLTETWSGQVKSATIIGGTVSQRVRADLRACGIENISDTLTKGADRYATAELICKEGLENGLFSTDTLVLAKGSKAADALSISSWSYAYKLPILLTADDKSMTEETQKLVREFDHVIILGGCTTADRLVDLGIASENIVNLTGNTRYETSVLISDYLMTNYGGSMDGAVFAMGADKNFPDSLAGGMLAGRSVSPILLVSADTDSEASYQYAADKIKDISTSVKLYALGAAAFDNTVISRLEKAIN